MPDAVTHILVPMLLVAIYRDYFVKDKKKFPLYYVFFAGLAGALPDADVFLFLILSFKGYTYEDVHQTYSHSIFVPIIFLAIALLTLKAKPFKIKKLEFRASILFFLLSFSFFSHLLLDFIFTGVRMFYPDQTSYGPKLIMLAPRSWRGTLTSLLDAIFLVIWIVYEEFKRKKNF